MPTIIFAKQFAEVVRRLREQGVGDGDDQLFAKFQNAFQIVLGGSVAQRSSQINIDLPNLDDNVQADIVKDNVVALSAIYFSAQLEELKFFQVADKVAEQFQTGMIPTSRSAGGEAVYRYIREAVNRFTENERRSIYARAFGFAQGSVDEPLPNREFSDLWIRFLSAVSILTREQKATIRQALTNQQVFKSARDLAVNLSLHGYGIAHFAAVEVQATIKSVIKMLSFPDILSAYGVNDLWQLIERVSGIYLGGAANSVRARTLAQSGSRIIQFLADKQPVLASNADPRQASIDFTTEPQLVADIESWLAVMGTDDTSLDKYSEPVSVASQPTIPNMSLQSLPDLQGIMSQQNGLQNAMHNLSGLTPVGKA
jgi:hypothetical protein